MLSMRRNASSNMPSHDLRVQPSSQVRQHLLPQPCLISIHQKSLEANLAWEAANLTHGQM